MSIRLVAEREVRARLRTKSFRVALAITVLGVVAAIVVPGMFDDPPEPYWVAFSGDAPAPLVDAVRNAGAAAGRVVEVVEAGDARGELRDGSLDLLVVDGRELVVRRAPSATDTGTFARFLSTAGAAVGAYWGLVDSGLSPEEAQRALSQRPLPVRGLVPPRDDRTNQKIVVSFGIILIFVFIQQYGGWVLNGIIEEKQSRVVEVLLSVLRPGELLLGKTIGIGVVALLHGAVVAVAALATAVVTGSTVLADGGTALVLVMLGWFLLAYCLYCLLMAVAGSLVARQEEAQNAAFPFLMPLLVAYVVSVGTVFGDTTPPLVKVLSFVPLTSPVSMPARLAGGEVSNAEVAASAALLLAAIVMVARVASAVYARGVLHTGAKLRLRDVLRGA